MSVLVEIEKHKIKRDTTVNRVAQADEKNYKKFLKSIDKG